MKSPKKSDATFKLDVDACIELFQELILDEGSTVFEKYWDSDAPGAGADSETVYLYTDLYWANDSTLGLAGPYESLEDALFGDMTAITDATKWITCTELEPKELLPYLWICGEPPNEITINDETWAIEEDGFRLRE